MLTIDSQVHIYEGDHPARPWRFQVPGLPEATGETVVGAMDAAGVDAALIVLLYEDDTSYERAVHAAHPGRFGLVKPVDAFDPDVADDIARWASEEDAVGVRTMVSDKNFSDAIIPGLDRIMAAAGRHSLPVNFLSFGRLDLAGQLARRHPNTRLVVDHCGLRQPLTPPRPAEPFAALPELLALAAHDNVVLKLSGACVLSNEPFPYPDLWGPLSRIFDAFGFERCMWGTDWTRTVEFLSYQQGVDAFRDTDRLSDGEKETFMSKTVQEVYGWSPG